MFSFITVITTFIFAVVITMFPNMQWLLLVAPLPFLLYLFVTVFISPKPIPSSMKLEEQEKNIWKRYYAFIQYPSASRTFSSNVDIIRIILFILGVILLLRGGLLIGIILIVIFWFPLGTLAVRLNPFHYMIPRAQKGDKNAANIVNVIQLLIEKRK